MAEEKENIKKRADRKRISPFRNVDELEKEIIKFMNVNKVSFTNHAKRMSDYFEMCCFNYIVKFYKAKGYSVSIENLQKGKYRYKCSSQGNQENFSNFKISKKSRAGEVYDFAIYHNLAVQSYHQSDIYTTPDITIIQYGKIEIDKEHYSGKKRLSFVPNDKLISFCEVKQFHPFPELMFNFIGTINELMHSIMGKNQKDLVTSHIAPSLMISGKPNEHAKKIKKSLESRYCINIIYDLFSSLRHPFSTPQIKDLRTIKRQESLTKYRFLEQDWE